MRRIWISVILAAIVAILCITEGKVITDSTEDIKSFAEKISSSKDLDYKTLDEEFNELYKSWEDSRELLSAFIHHCDVDSVSQSLSLVGSYIHSEKDYMLKSECSRLKEVILSLNDSEIFSIANIL